jgi:hypothetical protein
MVLAGQRKKRDMATSLSMATLAARGKPKVVKDQIKKLSK